MVFCTDTDHEPTKPFHWYGKSLQKVSRLSLIKAEKLCFPLNISDGQLEL